MTQKKHSNARSRWVRWRWPAAVAAVVLVASAVVTSVVLSSDEGGTGAPPPATTTVVPSTTSPPTSSSQPSTSTPSTTTSAPATETTEPQPVFAFQFLWPFADQAGAEAWQASYRSGGHQPWHLDAGMTAQSFTTGFLGYTDNDQITTRNVAGAQAWIGVGHKLPNNTTATAALIHLAKVGSAKDAPWEVGGTLDTTLTLTRPAYGAVVTSPVLVGGRITGVDENLIVQIRTPGGAVAGSSGGVPAGGANTPWTAPVVFKANAGTVLTIAVATGGHVTAVERFAITGVRAAGSPSAG